MSAKKMPERDLASARRLHAWMSENGYKDWKVAEKTKMSASTVKTWRRGVRPNSVAREALRKLVGWDWDNPPGFGEAKATSPDMVPGTVGVEPVPLHPQMHPRKKSAQVHPRKSAKQLGAEASFDPAMIAGGVIIPLLAARARLRKRLKTRTLNFADKADVRALNLALESLDEVIILREQSDAGSTKVLSLYTQVVNSRDPEALLALITAYEEPAVVDAIRYALDIGSVRTGKRRMAS